MTETTVNPNQALWEKGDFTRIAASMRESGEALVAGLGVTAGMKVLDLGCGDGTTALPMARRGADVLGVDIARNLVDRAAQRALGIVGRHDDADVGTHEARPSTKRRSSRLYTKSFRSRSPAIRSRSRWP